MGILNPIIQDALLFACVLFAGNRTQEAGLLRQVASLVMLQGWSQLSGSGLTGRVMSESFGWFSGTAKMAACLTRLPGAGSAPGSGCPPCPS